MKRLLIATLALTTILTACSDGSEPVGEYDNPEAKAEMEANLAEAEAEESAEEVGNSERHQFEVGPSLAKQRAAEEESDDSGEQSLDEFREYVSKYNEASAEVSREMAQAIDNVSLQTFEMQDVIIKVKSVERSKFANGTRVDVNYHVENTVKERRMVPLERTIIVTNDGTQVEYDRDVSNLPEWDLVSDTKTEGTVSFYLKDVEPSEVESVDVNVPGVDFKRSDDELFTVYFNE